MGTLQIYAFTSPYVLVQDVNYRDRVTHQYRYPRSQILFELEALISQITTSSHFDDRADTLSRAIL